MNNINFKIKNQKILSLVNKCEKVAFIISCFATLLFWINKFYLINIDLFVISLSIFQTGIVAAIFSVICGIYFENYINT